MSLYLFVRNRSWVVDRRTELVPSVHAHKSHELKLFLFFTAPDGEIRRSDIADDFPADPAPRLLESVWRYAEVIRAGDPGEMTTRAPMVVPRVRDVMREFTRALLLRCPNCGGGKVLKTWFRLKHRCAKCGIRLDRGEAGDYAIGAMYFNIAIAEILFAMALLVVLVATWPNVPWAGMEYSLVGAMLAAPVVFYPVSRLMWLALDLLLRPPDSAEMAWHSAAKDE